MATPSAADAPGTLAFGRASPLADADQHRDNVARVRVVLGVAAPLWSACALLDWTVVAMGHAGDLALLLSLRALGTLAFLLVFARLSMRPPPTPRALVGLDLFAYTTATIALSLMCVDYRGLESPYAHGVTFLLVTRGVAYATPWRHGLLLLGIPAISHPLTMVAAAAWSPLVRAQLGEGRALVAFGQDLFFLVLTALALVVSKHMVWSMRAQLYAARKVGRYELKRELGSGGMGAVWLAHDRTLGRDVALKILLPNVATTPGMIERFGRELRATAELSHPNTVRVFDGGVTDDGLWFFAMEPLEGETLWSLLNREKALPVRRAVVLVRQAAHALAEAHGRGIVHRDVKPENLFVCSGAPEQLKLLDFGIARVPAQSTGPALTGVGWVVGTPAFMAPEQAAGFEAIAASDVYSLGAVLYAALTGRPPIDAATPGALMAGLISEPILPPSLRMSCELPVELEQIVLKCLSKSWSNRYPSAAELAAALDAIELPDHDASSEVSPSRLHDEAPTRRLAAGTP
jgi:eukaryotic-like serine/threonine-protein kinase